MRDGLVTSATMVGKPNAGRGGMVIDCRGTHMASTASHVLGTGAAERCFALPLFRGAAHADYGLHI